MDLVSDYFRKSYYWPYTVRFEINWGYRTIVPIYQSEVSPPTHVSGLECYFCNVSDFFFDDHDSVELLLAWNLLAMYSAMLLLWYVLSDNTIFQI